ncbi:MAG: 30S ribosome-binding factor RbfA [Cyanobium sp.]
MAQGRRVERVAALIRREVSELLRSGIKDERIHSGLVSVTHAEVAGDLQHCRIFVSVLGSDEDRTQVLAGLKAAAPFVKGELGRRLRLRRTPEVAFQLDRGLERGTSVLELLHRLEEERQERADDGDDGDAADANGDDNGNDSGADTNDASLDPA